MTHHTIAALSVEHNAPSPLHVAGLVGQRGGNPFVQNPVAGRLPIGLRGIQESAAYEDSTEDTRQECPPQCLATATSAAFGRSAIPVFSLARWRERVGVRVVHGVRTDSDTLTLALSLRERELASIERLMLKCMV